MGSRSSTGGTILHSGLVCLHVGNELRERICWKSLRSNDRARCLNDEAERREIGKRVVGRLLVERLTPGMSAAVADDELIAIRRRFRDPQRTKRATCAGGVLDHDLLAQFLAQALRNDTPGNIARATGGERHHKRERATGKTLGGGW